MDLNTSLRNLKDAQRIVMDKISAKMFGLILPQVSIILDLFISKLVMDLVLILVLLVYCI